MSAAVYSPAEVRELLAYLTPDERAEVQAALSSDTAIWRPLPGPQFLAYHSDADIIGYGGAAGGGKLQPVDALVLTPFGWREIGTLRVGSKVCATDGTVASVIGVYPQGIVPIYRVVMADGSVCEVGLEHNWLVWQSRGLRKIGNEVTHGEAGARKMTTGQIAEAMVRGQRYRIPVTHPVAFNMAGALVGPGKFVGRPITPYILGLLLGDGSICRKHGISVTTADEEIVDALRDEFPDNLYTGCKENSTAISVVLRGEAATNTWAALQALKLAGCKSETKFIPKAYLFAPTADRWGLLQGLMDTDGWVEPKRCAYYTTVSARLADDVTHLARSLGALVTRTIKAPHYTYKGEKKAGRTAYCLRIKLREPVRAFRLERKRQIAAGLIAQSMGNVIERIEYARDAQAVCIQVDHPNSLYLTNDFMVTHNSDLAIGKALTQHRVAQIFRRQGTELGALIDRMVEIVGHNRGLSRGQPPTWRNPVLGCALVEFGSVPNLGDESKYQGRAKDLLVLDEATNFLEAMVRFLMGWVRTTVPGLHPQTLLTFNPPTSAEGRWIVEFFAPWLDKKFPNPAQPGELRYCAMLPRENGTSSDLWVDGPRPFVLVAGKPCYDFDARNYPPEAIIRPLSRTFIPSRVRDNPYLLGTNYMSQLQAMPEPLRSQMLNGDFNAGMEDDAYQVIPTAWVEAAMARWRPLAPKPRMDSVGVDVARGGKDNTIIARRHGNWYDELLAYPGTQTPDGPIVAALVIGATRDQAPQHVDVIGVGASPYDFLRKARQQVLGVNVAEQSIATDKSGRLRFTNLRSQLWWQMREKLDPASNLATALPPDKRLLADLCAPRWELAGRTVTVEGREDIIDRIGRSPDYASAVILAQIDTPRVADLPGAEHTAFRGDYDPYRHRAGSSPDAPRDHDPYGVLR